MSFDFVIRAIIVDIGLERQISRQAKNQAQIAAYSIKPGIL